MRRQWLAVAALAEALFAAFFFFFFPLDAALAC